MKTLNRMFYFININIKCDILNIFNIIMESFLNFL